MINVTISVLYRGKHIRRNRFSPLLGVEMNFHSTFLCFPGKELKINVRLCGEGELEMNFKCGSSGKKCMCVCGSHISLLDCA